MSITTINLHFKIYGSGITNLLHQLREEGHFGKAKAIINCFASLTHQQKIKIFREQAILDTDETRDCFYHEISYWEWINNHPQMTEEISISELTESKESTEYPENVWISPDGKIYNVGYEQHRYVAEEICKALEIDCGYGIWNAERYLEKHSWIKISQLEFYIHRGITDRQIDALRDYIEHNYRKVIYYNHMSFSISGIGIDAWSKKQIQPIEKLLDMIGVYKSIDFDNDSHSLFD